MKKKVLVIVCSIIIVMSISIVQVLVNLQNTNSNEPVYSDDNLGYDYLEEGNENNYDDYYKEETTEAIKLSDNCDKILATGADKNGNFYELVANQEETYNDVKIKVGVIKNNEWLLEPTSNMPFIDQETGLLKGGYPNIGIDNVKIHDDEFDNVYGTFKYVADGCFCVYNGITKNLSYTGDPQCLIVYNTENKNTFYNTYNKDKYKSSNVFTSFYKDAACGKYLLIEKSTRHKSDFFILDTNTMETKMIVEGTEYNIVGPVCDGLFAVGNSTYSSAIMYFYDLEGNEVIDLTSYNKGYVHGVYKSYFIDERFTFFSKNSVGTEFQVTIDTKGNVVDSVEN